MLRSAPRRCAHQKESCSIRIRESDVFLLIIGTSYGTLVPHREESFTEYEYQAAKKAGKPIIAFALAGARAASFDDSKLIEHFVERLQRERSVQFFSTVTELQDKITAALILYKESQPGPDFEISFDPELGEHQIVSAFEALADYYRAWKLCSTLRTKSKNASLAN